MYKHKIMFVCHGNICRSPMAEFIFKNMVNQSGQAEHFLINSSATSTEEIGNSIYPPAKRELQRQGIPFDDHRAIQLTKADYDKYDMFIVMDFANYKNALRIFGEDKMGKVSLLLSHVGQNREVSDPWYTGDFAVCFDDIETGCKALLNEILHI